MKVINSKNQKVKSHPYTNIIAIDPSTTCTGLTINGNIFCICPEDVSKNKNGNYKKWFHLVSNECNILTFNTPFPKGISFTKKEILKLEKYDLISNMIVDTIKTEVSNISNSICIIEGFSYNSSAGHLIDLVTFSTLLRWKLNELNIVLEIIPPASLKVATAKLAYQPIDVGKKKQKLEWRNHSGKSGGKFQKPDMLQAILDSDLDDDWYHFLHSNEKELKKLTSIPKPIDDINDSYLLYHCYLTNVINT